MAIRDWIATAVINYARVFGRTMGAQLVVDVDEHEIETKMEVPNKSKRAWDDDLYHRGQIYYDGYANPVKIGLEHGGGVQHEDAVEQDVGPDETTVMASQRYQDFMEMDMVEALLNPQEQWRYVLYAAIAAAVGGSLSAIMSAVVVFG